jgi:hypothetical protein
MLASAPRGSDRCADEIFPNVIPSRAGELCPSTATSVRVLEQQRVVIT